ncbi:nucleotidyltransferase domain-containing protein [Catellatospora sp. KI3]|uniref:nucleotidyltransferase domain-containing protein n=1 Tax=Catellatospora sp. KI3 TaxID=3041620 RepID=UPI002482A78E|nr:nucleotidyltransferase domain-containing protein [Catellatospora sp. KI3]MDI1465703.1 nucleotidyltransferase domain-containing protein [Catellatospora sp. KI3]
MDAGHGLVERYTILSVVVGSRAYGLDGPGSDTDRRGVYAAPTRLFWHLDKPPTHVEGPRHEEFSWEVERLCALALTANPTVLECLWSPLVERITPAGQRLLAVREAFLSRRAADTYGRYAADQFAKLTGHFDRTGEVRWKQAMHMLRLLRAGAHVLRTGQVLVEVRDERELLLSVKRGELPFERVRELARERTEQLAAAAAAPVLPVEPDRAAVDAFLAGVREEGLDSAEPAVRPI